MVFLKEQTETKNGKEYTNYYFYHGNTYLGKAEDGLSSIQANIKSELGEAVDPEKIEKLQEQAREKMQTEVKDNSEDDMDLDLDLDHWSRAKKRETSSHLAVWEFGKDRDVTVEIQENRLDDSTYDVLERVGGYTEHEIATNVMDVEKAIDEAERAMLTANENKAQMADSGNVDLLVEPDVSDEMVEDAQGVSVKNWEWVDPEENMVDDQEKPIARWENTEVDSPITDGNVQINTHTTSYTRDDDQARVQKFTTVLNADSPGEMSRRNYESFSSALNRAENWMQDHPEASADGFSDSEAEYELSESNLNIYNELEDRGFFAYSGADGDLFRKQGLGGWRIRIYAHMYSIQKKNSSNMRSTTNWSTIFTVESESDDEFDKIESEYRKNLFLEQVDKLVEEGDGYEAPDTHTLSDIEAKPPEIGDEFYHVRVRDPSKYETERVPDWASDVAGSESEGSKVKMGKLGQGDWEVQSVMIKKSNVDRKKAKDLAERIAKKVDGSDSEMGDSALSKGDMVSWGDSNEDRYGVVVSVKSDGCFDERIDGDFGVCASDDERAVLIESMSEDSRGKMLAHKEGTLREVSKSELKDSGDTDIFAGDEFADKIANQGLIYDDWDEDSVANIDDRDPLNPGSPESERINDEILLSEELQNIEELSQNHREVYEMLKDEVDVHKGRVKQPESILKKLHEKYSEEVTDIIGVTVYADDKNEVMDIADQLKRDHDLFPIGEERADENHYEDDEFYRAYHLIIAVEKDGETYPAEIQIKTKEQAKLHGLAHEYYKSNEPMPELLEKKARQLESGEISSVDVSKLKNQLP